jgi:ABC-2 type transport system ATP-binding protein
MSSAQRPPAISVVGLRKSFGDTVVLDGIDITVPVGTVFSLLGPNGAGKTTIVEILSTLRRAEAGTATVAGCDVVADADGVRSVIGVTGQFAAVDELLTGEENLRLMADLHHLPKAEGRRRAAALLERFELTAAARKPTSTYSGGMVRRLDVAMTLIAEPRIIFLDEPTTGLDPRSRRAVWDIVRELVAGGVSIFLTTQYLDEADELADRIAVLDQGRIVASGTPDELKRLVPGGYIRVQFATAADLDAAGSRLPDAVRDEQTRTLQVPSDGGVRALRAVLDRLDDAGAEPAGLSVHTPNLDDVFLTLTGRPTGASAPDKSTPDRSTPEQETVR